MIKKFLIFFLLVTASYASTVDEVIRQIQEKYKETQDIQGRFSQTSYIKDLEMVKRYEGRFFISRGNGGGIKLVYTKPADEEVIIKDTGLWIYKKSERQAFKSKFTKDSYAQIPMSLLHRIEDIKTDFNITILKEGALELRPMHQGGLIKKILLVTTTEDLPVKSITVFDVYGNKTQIVLRDIEINTGLDESIFVFKAPKGIEIFELNP